MVPVGNFTISYNNNSDLHLAFSLSTEKKIIWPGGSPPKDSPKCGFDNELCPAESTDAESSKSLLYLNLFHSGSKRNGVEV